MEFITNSTFRIISENAGLEIEQGIYRVIFEDIQSNTIVATVIIKKSINSDEEIDGKLDNSSANKLVGNLKFINRRLLLDLLDENGLEFIEITRIEHPKLSPSSQKIFEARCNLMSEFLDAEILHHCIINAKSIAPLVKRAASKFDADRSHIYKLWSLLCKNGLHKNSLMPRYYKSGASGVSRPCDPNPLTNIPRAKAGRKTGIQSIALKYGRRIDSVQQGITSAWVAKIRAADARIPSPKPKWPKRIEHIQRSAFCSKIKIDQDGWKYVLPEIGQYPNAAQIKHTLTYGVDRLDLLRQQTTKHHFKMNKRGLIGRSWEGVSGPNHNWAIDSTVGDIYLRSSVDRRWIIGRPIVYIVVDVWSTAVVGFHVCLTGPSWAEAKVSIFNAASHGTLSKFISIHTDLGLYPIPTLPYSILFDRGEYLSKGHRETAFKLFFNSAYTPPYRGDLKGNVEVLHRIKKDEQFYFIPGAMDFRRAELELRRVDPEKCVFTIQEYTQYLYFLFQDYNLTADRRHRLDAQMLADGVFPSPAGLWSWGHSVGIGMRRQIKESDLIRDLLPMRKASIRRDGIHFGGNNYLSQTADVEYWTTYARNFGSFQTEAWSHPFNIGNIWTPDVSGGDLQMLNISDQSRAPASITFDEWLDVKALDILRNPEAQHQKLKTKLSLRSEMASLISRATRETQQAKETPLKHKPTFTEARQIEIEDKFQPNSDAAQTDLKFTTSINQMEADHEDLIHQLFNNDE